MNDARSDSEAPSERQLDMESLKALSHPLRVRLLDTLSAYGDFTASGLAERLGESSGATSYHLRQLEKHGFVREVADKGTGRERWWQRVPGGLTLTSEGIGDSAAGRAVARTVVKQWEDNRSALLRDFQERGHELLGMEWVESTVVSTTNLRLTKEQLHDLVQHWDVFINEYVDRYRGQNPPGSRAVQIHFNAFPIADGEETPNDGVTP